MSHTIAVMYLGKIVEWGDADAVALDAEASVHEGAVRRRAADRPRRPRRRRSRCAGRCRARSTPPSGCRFHPRCPFAMPHCATEEPALRAESGRLVACHLYSEEGVATLPIPPREQRVAPPKPALERGSSR